MCNRDHAGADVHETAGIGIQAAEGCLQVGREGQRSPGEGRD